MLSGWEFSDPMPGGCWHPDLRGRASACRRNLSIMLQIPRDTGIRGFWCALWYRPRALAFGAWMTVFPLIFMIPMEAMMKSTFPRQPDHARIQAEGKEASGRVRRVEPVYNTVINGVHPERVLFTYVVDGQTANGSMDTLSVDLVSGWKPGDAITVKYLNGEATIPDLQTAEFPVELFVMMPLVFGILGLPFLIYALAGALRMRRLLRLGEMRRAKLFSMVPMQSFGMWGAMFLKTRFETSYTFEGEGGKVASGSSTTSDLGLLNEKKKGDDIDILVVAGRDNETLIVDCRVRRLLQMDA